MIRINDALGIHYKHLVF